MFIDITNDFFSNLDMATKLNQDLLYCKTGLYTLKVTFFKVYGVHYLKKSPYRNIFGGLGFPFFNR